MAQLVGGVVAQLVEVWKLSWWMCVGSVGRWCGGSVGSRCGDSVGGGVMGQLVEVWWLS